MEEVIMTKEGMEEKKKHLDYLKSVRRLEVAELIKAAREYGDLSENSEYDAARNEQRLLEAEIEMLEETLRNAKVVDKKSQKSGVVSIGSTVIVHDEEFDEDLTYTIVGSIESKPTENIISNQSPIGAALMGKKEGDTVIATAPGGAIKLKIVSVK